MIARAPQQSRYSCRVSDGIWRLELYNSLYALPTNVFALPSGHGTLDIIDTSLGLDWIQLVRALREIGYTPEQVRGVFLTHAHEDHAGNASRFVNARIFLGEREARQLMGQGTVKQQMRGALSCYAVCRDASRLNYLRPGEQAKIGASLFRVISLRGHSPDSLGFVNDRVSFIGDCLTVCSFSEVGGMRGVQRMRRMREFLRKHSEADPREGYVEAKRALAELRSEIICAGHGPHLSCQAFQTLRKFILAPERLDSRSVRTWIDRMRWSWRPVFGTRSDALAPTHFSSVGNRVALDGRDYFVKVRSYPLLIHRALDNLMKWVAGTHVHKYWHPWRWVDGERMARLRLYGAQPLELAGISAVITPYQEPFTTVWEHVARNASRWGMSQWIDCGMKLMQSLGKLHSADLWHGEANIGNCTVICDPQGRVIGYRWQDFETVYARRTDRLFRQVMDCRVAIFSYASALAKYGNREWTETVVHGLVQAIPDQEVVPFLSVIRERRLGRTYWRAMCRAVDRETYHLVQATLEQYRDENDSTTGPTP